MDETKPERTPERKLETYRTLADMILDIKTDGQAIAAMLEVKEAYDLGDINETDFGVLCRIALRMV